MPTFNIPYVTPNAASWGPTTTTDKEDTHNPAGSKFGNLPYAPFGRSDRLGRCADFTGRYQHYDPRRHNQKRDDNKEFQYKVDQEEQSSFQLVDTSKTSTSNARRFVTPASRRRQHSARLRQVNARRQAQNAVVTDTKFQHAGRVRSTGRGGRGGGRFGGRGGRGRPYQARIDRQASVAVLPEWKQVEELDLAKITKNMTTSTELPTSTEDLLWCGFVDGYNDQYDKVSARAPVPLKRSETKEFYPVTTTDDPVLERFAIDEVANVFCTDAILAHLMTCTRSVYPWDLVIQKLPNGLLFIDKRDNSTLDFLTVHETSYTPPTNSDDNNGINTPERLGLEATMVHQNFSQQILLKKSQRKSFDLPNPFFDPDDNDEGMEPASVGYRYRKFDLGSGIKLCCRTEVHGYLKKTDSYMTSFCLNEYIPSSLHWKDKIDSQRGAVLANELKNNSFQVAKWVSQSLLAGASQIKLGFVTRASPKNAYEHLILGTQFYRPKDLATQISLSEGNLWGTLRLFVELLGDKPEGKYVLMRDPNKGVVRLFAVPPNTFEEEE